MHLAEMVERAGLLRVGKDVLAALVFDLDEALFDVDVRRAVLSHGAELHEVGRRGVLAHRPKNVQGSCNVIHLGHDAAALVDHGERGRGLLTEMDNGLGLEVAQHVADKVVFAQIADQQRNGGGP